MSAGSLESEPESGYQLWVWNRTCGPCRRGHPQACEGVVSDPDGTGSIICRRRATADGEDA